MQEMKVWPFAAALAEGGGKPPHAALAEDRRGERCGKGARMRQVGIGKTVRSPRFRGSLWMCRYSTSGIKTGGRRSARDRSGGCPLFGQAVPGMRAA